MSAAARRGLGLVALIAALAGCAIRPDAHAPPFASKPYAAFSRSAAIGVAEGEWRYWGSPVIDGPADDDPALPPPALQERDNAAWQEVGLYWWIGMNAGHPEDRWTGKHDAAGRVFPRAVNGRYAWSAAFISYVMRMAGAGPHFPYAPDHAHYIDAAWRAAHDATAHGAKPSELLAENPETFAPAPGDLICAGRASAAHITYADLPTKGYFPAHCAIVVAAAPSELSVIGGNVDNTVALTHVPLTARGTLLHRDGTIVDPRYDWFVVLRVIYRRD